MSLPSWGAMLVVGIGVIALVLLWAGFLLFALDEYLEDRDYERAQRRRDLARELRSHSSPGRHGEAPTTPPTSIRKDDAGRGTIR